MIWLCWRFPWVNRIGPVVICYVAGITLGNVGVLSASAMDVQQPVSEVSVALALPLLLFSILPVKAFRYMIPLIPIVGASLFTMTPKSLARILGWMDKGRKLFGDRTRRMRWGSLIAVLLIIISPSVVLKIVRSPDQGVDSHYAEASDNVADYCTRNRNITIEVVSFYHQTLEYYLERDHEDIENYHLVNLYYNSTSLLERFENGEIDLVIDLENNERFEDEELYIMIRENYFTMTEMGGGLVLYRMR